MVKNLKPLYYESVLRGIAFSFFGIFVPIYFLTLGFSLNSVLIYFLIFHTTTFIFTPISIVLSRRFGIKRLMISSIPLVVLYLFLLLFLDKYSIPIYLISVVSGIKSAFYFIPYHFYFSKLSKDGSRGSQYSKLEALGKSIGLIGPIIGGIIATYFGFSVLFSLSLFFLIISSHPLLRLDNIKPNARLSIREGLKLYRNNKDVFIWEIADTIK
ncbi:MAG: MFS transporter, partial [Nanoarchaeota archaeon]|nr:MFS transporter [Nanoarchaeota archaeon]